MPEVTAPSQTLRRCAVVSVIALVMVAAVLASGYRHRGFGGELREAERYLTQSSDLDRYFAYANATLGRPYQRFYVRPADQWRQTFTAGAPRWPLEPIVTPARALVPYRDFLVEYPPGFFIVAIPPALFVASVRDYALVFGAVMVALMLLAAFICTRIAMLAGVDLPGYVLLAWIVTASVCLGTLVTQRYDATVALLLCAMCWASLARRPAILGLAAGGAVVLKIVPALAAVVCAIFLFNEGRRADLRRALLWATVTIAVICAPALYAGPMGLLDMARYHLDRPLEIGSTAAGVLGLWHAVDPASVAVAFTFGSQNLVGRHRTSPGGLASRWCTPPHGARFARVRRPPAARVCCWWRRRR